MSKNLERIVALEQTEKEDLGDDVVFEPSADHGGSLVGIAIKNGERVCWNCFKRVGGRDHVDAVLGMGALVRLCESDDCGARVGELNAERSERERKGLVVNFGDLSEPEREQLVDELARKKRELRGR